MKFIGRKEELNDLLNLYNRDGFQAGLIYGRRRIGKSELIKESLLSSKKKFIYYECKETNEIDNVNSISSLLTNIFNLPPLKFNNLEEILKFIFELAKNETIIFVLDEYPYLRNKLEGCDSIIQSVIDENKFSSNLKLIICGSYVETMKKLLKEENPLYGRMSLIINLKAMDYYESSRFYESFSNEDKLSFYCVFGGIPYYNSLIDEKKSFKENIIEILLKNNSPLKDEIRNYLYSQLQKIENANLVFDIISKGYVKFKDILNYSRISSSPTLVDTLNKLIQMELIKKEYPINDENNNKIAKYLIDDNLSLFFYTFIYPYSSTLSIMSPDTFFDLMIKEKFYRYYVPKIFEKVSKEYLIRQNKLGLINPPFIKIGKYYYDDPVNKRNGEFDIVSEDINGFTFYECKYIEKKIYEEIINEEIEEVSKTSFNVSRYGFFSKKGYELKNRINENIKLYTLEDLYRK